MALSQERRDYLTDSSEDLKVQIAELQGTVAQQEAEADKYSTKAKANRALLDNLETDLAAKLKELEAAKK